MNIYRISRSPVINDTSGEGRWNIVGSYVKYASESRALACMENLVHMGGILPSANYYLLTIELPENYSCKELKEGQLPNNWRNNPYYTRRLGNDWYEANESLILKVPSCGMPEEYNFLINAKHEQFQQVAFKTIPFAFDFRVF
ncbi:RES family NAD+ phosphorylase [Solitalea sp. MAHUQ-68]|uniref:RES family NAD+ phosphorylase n=1 Tax=Solitalea agri TaxID=2953739 RepID=A0A9X2JDG6_9SPHI|nr:RES family NAD+ phosphorylase [Solitalea agri]MCO4294128.1 RES family NAD+ phosphorylase [Solitalea agri]